MWRYIFNYLSIIFPTSRFFWLKSKILRLANVQIGQNVSVCSQCWIYGHGKIKIGSETWLSQGVKFLTHNDAQITIGKFCDIGPFVKFLTGGHEISSHKRVVAHWNDVPSKIKHVSSVQAFKSNYRQLRRERVPAA